MCAKMAVGRFSEVALRAKLLRSEILESSTSTDTTGKLILGLQDASGAIFGLGGLTGMAVGTAVAMWSSSTIDYTRIGCATQAACEATATNGALWATLGFGANSFWTASAITDNLAVIGLIPPPTPGGSYNAALDFYINNTGYVPTKSDCLDLTTVTFKANDVCGSGSLLGKGGANSPYDSFDNVDFTLRLVPEPGTLGLLGIALAGFGAASRRNKKQAA